jgi:hypothetical protein
VRVRAQNPHGKELVVEEEGLPARVIQHELDHLEGVLILDRISREARREAMRALREAREGKDGRRAASRAAPHAAEGEEAPVDSSGPTADTNQVPRPIEDRPTAPA